MTGHHRTLCTGTPSARLLYVCTHTYMDNMDNDLRCSTTKPVLPCKAWGFGSPMGRRRRCTKVSKPSGAEPLLCSQVMCGRSTRGQAGWGVNLHTCLHLVWPVWALVWAPSWRVVASTEWVSWSGPFIHWVQRCRNGGLPRLVMLAPPHVTPTYLGSLWGDVITRSSVDTTRIRTSHRGHRSTKKAAESRHIDQHKGGTSCKLL